MEYTTINVFGVLVEYFVVFAFLWIFFETNPRRIWWQRICHVLIPVLFFLYSTYISSIYIRPFIYILTSWLVTISFIGPVWQRLFSMTVLQILLILLEFFVGAFLNMLGDGITYNYYLIGNLVSKSLSILMLGVMFFAGRGWKAYFGALKRMQSFILIIFSICSLLMSFIVYFLLVQIDEPNLYVFGFVAIGIAIISNIGLYVLFYHLSIAEQNRNRLAVLDLHMAQQKTEQERLAHAHAQIRQLNHDMKHYITVVLSLLEQGETQEAIAELQKRQVHSTTHTTIDTGYPVLDSILTYKFDLAKTKQIQTQLFWQVKKPIRIDITDFAVMLGNALDNAIEAAEQVKTITPFISVTISESTQQKLLLRVTNSAAQAPQTDGDKLLIRKKDKLLHGIGFDSIRQLAAQYQGETLIDYDEGVFTLSILMENVGGKIWKWNSPSRK